MIKNRMLIFLDSIIDTRLGCVRSINEEWAKSLLEKGYRLRLSNLLSRIDSDIDDAAIKERWSNRDVDILQLSRCNQILALLAEDRKNTQLVSEEHPEALNVEVTINCWPYKLNSDERKMFIEVIKTTLIAEEVNLIYRDIAYINPLWINENFDQVILYDMNEWLMIHSKNLVANKIPKVVFTFPFCLLDEVEPHGLNIKEMIDYLKLSFAGLLTIDVVPLSDTVELNTDDDETMIQK